MVTPLDLGNYSIDKLPKKILLVVKKLPKYGKMIKFDPKILKGYAKKGSKLAEIYTKKGVLKPWKMA